MTESKENHENPTEPLPWQREFLKLTERRVMGKSCCQPAQRQPDHSRRHPGCEPGGYQRRDPSARGELGLWDDWEPGDKHIKIAFKMGERKKRRESFKTGERMRVHLLENSSGSYSKRAQGFLPFPPLTFGQRGQKVSPRGPAFSIRQPTVTHGL